MQHGAGVFFDFSGVVVIYMVLLTERVMVVFVYYFSWMGGDSFILLFSCCIFMGPLFRSTHNH